jgi:tryptophanyl-tRNA synthetase
MKELCFSGIQPTNIVHIGNYIGALKQWTDIQHRFPCLFCIVDMHAITVPQNPEELRRNNLRLAATYMAVGLDPKRSHLFIQSEVAEHAELAWILGTLTKLAELERMTQFKDKAKKQKENVGAGLFTYPALMAADILLYDTTVVPVGEDQLQHIELARTVARRFNQRFGDTFVIPKGLVQKTGARIMGLDDPGGKMSKSASSSMNYIALTDSDDDIAKKIKKAVTDSGTDVAYDETKRPAISNLMTVYHHATGKKMNEIKEAYAGKGYGAFKADLADAVIAMVKPIREKIERYMSDSIELFRVLDAGRNAAKEMASAKMEIVRKNVGLGR